MLSVSFLLADDRWHPLLQKERMFFRRVLRAGLKTDPLPQNRYTVTVLLTDDAEIRELNATWRHKDKPTNVLSFPMIDNVATVDPTDNPVHLGDLALSYDTMRLESRLAKKTLRAHAAHLLLHGLLHLIGHDHLDAVQAEKMEALEIAVLKEFGIRNPY